MFESPVTDIAQADPSDLIDPENADSAEEESGAAADETAPARAAAWEAFAEGEGLPDPVVAKRVTEPSSDPLTAEATKADPIVADIAARRADLKDKRRVRSTLWVFEPAIAYAAGSLLFLILGAAGMFLPLFGAWPDGEIVGWYWAVPLLLTAGAWASYLTMARRRRQAALLAGASDIPARHMSARQIGALIGVVLIIFILLGSASLLAQS